MKLRVEPRKTVLHLRAELEKRAAYFERRYIRTAADFDLGAASNLRAMARWAGSKKAPVRRGAKPQLREDEI